MPSSDSNAQNNLKFCLKIALGMMQMQLFCVTELTTQHFSSLKVVIISKILYILVGNQWAYFSNIAGNSWSALKNVFMFHIEYLSVQRFLHLKQNLYLSYIPSNFASILQRCYNPLLEGQIRAKNIFGTEQKDILNISFM